MDGDLAKIDKFIMFARKLHEKDAAKGVTNGRVELILDMYDSFDRETRVDTFNIVRRCLNVMRPTIEAADFMAFQDVSVRELARQSRVESEQIITVIDTLITFLKTVHNSKNRTMMFAIMRDIIVSA